MIWIESGKDEICDEKVEFCPENKSTKLLQINHPAVAKTQTDLRRNERRSSGMLELRTFSKHNYGIDRKSSRVEQVPLFIQVSSK